MRMALIVPVGVEMPMPRIFRSNTRTQKCATGTRATTDDTMEGIMVKSHRICSVVASFLLGVY